MYVYVYVHVYACVCGSGGGGDVNGSIPQFKSLLPWPYCSGQGTTRVIFKPVEADSTTDSYDDATSMKALRVWRMHKNCGLCNNLWTYLLWICISNLCPICCTHMCVCLTQFVITRTWDHIFTDHRLYYQIGQGEKRRGHIKVTSSMHTLLAGTEYTLPNIVHTLTKHNTHPYLA